MSTAAGGPGGAIASTRPRAIGSTPPVAATARQASRGQPVGPRVPPSEPKSGLGTLIVKQVLRDPDRLGGLRKSDLAAQQALCELHVGVEILLEEIGKVPQPQGPEQAKAHEAAVLDVHEQVNEAMVGVQKASEKAPGDLQKLFAERVEQNVTQMRPDALRALQHGAQELFMLTKDDKYDCVATAATKELAWKEGMQKDLDQQMQRLMHELVDNNPLAALDALREVENLSEAYVVRMRPFDTPEPHEETTRMVLMVDAWRRNAGEHEALRDSFSTPGSAGYELSALIDHLKGNPALREHPQIRSELQRLSARCAVMTHWSGVEKHSQSAQTGLHGVQQPVRDAMSAVFGVHVDAYDRLSVRAGVALKPAQKVVKNDLKNRREMLRADDQIFRKDLRAELLAVLANGSVSVGNLPPNAPAKLKYAALCALVGEKDAPKLTHLINPELTLACASKISNSPASPIRGPEGTPGALVGPKIQPKAGGGAEVSKGAEARIHIGGQPGGPVVVECTASMENAEAFQPITPEPSVDDVLAGRRSHKPAAIRLSAGRFEYRVSYTISGKDIEDVNIGSPLLFQYELEADAPPARGRR